MFRHTLGELHRKTGLEELEETPGVYINQIPRAVVLLCGGTRLSKTL